MVALAGWEGRVMRRGEKRGRGTGKKQVKECEIMMLKTLAAFFLPSPKLNAHFLLRIEGPLGSPACHLSVLFVKLILPVSPTLLVIPV